MSFAIGCMAIGIGLMSMVGSVWKATAGELQRSDVYETNGVLWFILAAICFK